VFSIYIISSNQAVKDESQVINLLFQNGMQHFHLRKKTWMKNEVKQLIENIDSAYHNRIVLHHHPQLVFDFDLAGFHFNSAYPYQEEMVNKLRSNNKSVSVSSHSICDIGEYELEADYQFVSPIFPSISKPNVVETFNHQKLKTYFALKPKSKFIALGGIEPNKIETVKELKFDGAAILGYLWKAYETNENKEILVEKFNQINQNKINTQTMFLSL